MAQSTHPKAVMNKDQLTLIEEPNEISEATGLRPFEAERIIDIVERRAQMRGSGLPDMVLVLEEWATNWPDWDDPLSESRVVIAPEVEDYSEKAYYCVGAYTVDMDLVTSLTDDQFEDAWITDLVEIIDDTDDGAKAEGMTFFPKSAVMGIYTIR